MLIMGGDCSSECISMCPMKLTMYNIHVIQGAPECCITRVQTWILVQTKVHCFIDLDLEFHILDSDLDLDLSLWTRGLGTSLGEVLPKIGTNSVASDTFFEDSTCTLRE